MLPGHHARSPSKDRRCVHESKTAGRSRDRAAISPAPAATGLQSPSACRCGQSPAIPGPLSESGSRQPFKPAQNSQQGLHLDVAIDQDAPAVRAYDLDPPTARSGILFGRLRNDHRRHKSNWHAKPPRAIRLAPSKQKLIGNPVPTRRRRAQPSARKALLDDASLCLIRPSTAPTRVDNFKATDMATVSKTIHTDSQLHGGQFGKTAYAGWIRFCATTPSPRRWTTCSNASTRLRTYSPMGASVGGVAVRRLRSRRRTRHGHADPDPDRQAQRRRSGSRARRRAGPYRRSQDQRSRRVTALELAPRTDRSRCLTITVAISSAAMPRGPYRMDTANPHQQPEIDITAAPFVE